MGTRADFYVGRGANAEWMGSIGWDGYPDGVSLPLLHSSSEDDFRACLAAFASIREDWTAPERGWPWPWDSSHLTDYAYAFDGGKVWASNFGREWFVAAEGQPESEENDKRTAVFPDMKARKNVSFDKRSGLVIVEPTP